MRLATTIILSFNPVVLKPGQERLLRARPLTPFKPQRLVMYAEMSEIRGYFRIKRSRLPRLNRENVIAYSNVTRAKSKRRTTVEYREGEAGNFVRQYRPESVVYEHVDALSYLRLINLWVGKSHAMPKTPTGIAAEFFGTGQLGVGTPFPTSERYSAIKLRIRNTGDIKVRLNASLFGYGMAR